MAFITVYKDPKKKKLQQFEIAFMLVFLPIGLYFGYGAVQQWRSFKASEVHSLRGQEFLHAGQSDEALKELKQAARIYPENPVNWEAMGIIHHANGAHQEEAATYRSAMEAIPENGNLVREYGAALHELGKHDKELEFLRKAEKLGTNDDLFLSRLLGRAQGEADGTIAPSQARPEGDIPPLPTVPSMSGESVGNSPALESGHEGHNHGPGDGHKH